MKKQVFNPKIERVKGVERKLKRRKKRSFSGVYITRFNEKKLREFRENAFLESVSEPLSNVFITEKHFKKKRIRKEIGSRSKKPLT